MSRAADHRTGSGRHGHITRDLYLDLLIKTLANTIYGDPSNAYWNRGIVDEAIRHEGRDWPSQAHTMVGVLRLENLRDLVQRALDNNIPGHFIETGAWRGGCCILMRGVLAANAVADRRVYVADSFEGLPPPRVWQDAGDPHHSFKELAIGLDEVKSNFRKYGLLDEQVKFVKGFFHETLPALKTRPFALIRLDGDMYESTMTALEALYPKLSPGGFVIIDDYAIENCRHATTDFRDKYRIAAPVTEIDWTGVWWQKPA
jgi:O-methyltransferase